MSEFKASDSLKCYFFGHNLKGNDKTGSTGLTGFAIPDLGIVFRSQYNGNLFECQYTGLIALLKFINSNIKSFAGIKFEILSDSAVVVYQLTHKKFISKDLSRPFKMALDLLRNIKFNISWIPSEENIAVTGLTEMPPITPESDIIIEIDLKDKNKELGKGYIRF